MTAAKRKENCPFAYRDGGGRDVLCRKIAELPNIKWNFCAHSYPCRRTGRNEATENPNDCKFRRKTHELDNAL